MTAAMSSSAARSGLALPTRRRPWMPAVRKRASARGSAPRRQLAARLRASSERVAERRPRCARGCGARAPRRRGRRRAISAAQLPMKQPRRPGPATIDVDQAGRGKRAIALAHRLAVRAPRRCARRSRPRSARARSGRARACRRRRRTGWSGPGRWRRTGRRARSTRSPSPRTPAARAPARRRRRIRAGGPWRVDEKILDYTVRNRKERSRTGPPSDEDRSLRWTNVQTRAAPRAARARPRAEERVRRVRKVARLRAQQHADHAAQAQDGEGLRRSSTTAV